MQSPNVNAKRLLIGVLPRMCRSIIDKLVGLRSGHSWGIGKWYPNREAGTDAGLTGYVDVATQPLHILPRLIRPNAHSGQALGALERFEQLTIDKFLGHSTA